MSDLPEQGGDPADGPVQVESPEEPFTGAKDNEAALRAVALQAANQKIGAFEEVLAKFESSELDPVALALAQRWVQMENFTGTTNIGTEAGNRKLFYAASRDISSVLRHCVPMAAMMACKLKPGLAEGGLIDKIENITAALITAQAKEIPCIDDALVDLTSDKEITEGFVLYTACFFCALMLYVHVMPRMAQAMPGTWPDASDKLLSVRAEMLLLDQPLRKEHLSKAMGSIRDQAVYAAEGLQGGVEGYLDKMLPDFQAAVDEMAAELEARMRSLKQLRADLAGDSEDQSEEVTGDTDDSIRASDNSLGG